MFRTSRPAIALVFLSLAALLASTSGASPSAASGVTFGAPVTVDANIHIGEPGAKVAADGATVYVHAPHQAWRSDNGGATWTHLNAPAPCGCDADLDVDPAGNVYYSDLTVSCVTFSTSPDKGATWTTNNKGCGTAGNDDRQWVAIDHHAPLLGLSSAYLTFGSGSGGRNIVVVKFPVASLVNVALTPVKISNGESYQWPGYIAVDQIDGTVYVTYTTVDDNVIVFSSPDGATWTRHVVATHRNDTFDSFAVVAVDEGENVYTAWTERRADATGTDSFVAVSQDHGATWGAPIRVNTDAVPTTTYPWLVAGAAGHVGVVYYGSTTGAFSPETVGSAAPWQVYEATSLDMLGAATFSNVAATGVIHHGNICTSGTGCAPGTRGFLDFFTNAVYPDGSQGIAYNDDTSGSVLVKYVRQTGGPNL